MSRKANIINSLIEQHQQVIDAARLALDGELNFIAATPHISMVYKDTNDLPVTIPITCYTGEYTRRDLLEQEIKARKAMISELEKQLQTT